MSSTVIDVPLGPDHVREDGSPWPFALLLGEQTLLADTTGEVIAALIDGYGDLPEGPEGDEQALLLRAGEAIRLAATVQAVMAADAVHDGLMDVENESEEVLTVLLGDRTIPVVGVDRWEHAVPLVLVATDYAPFTAEAPPSGKVLWVDPSDEVSFLHSLANLGVIRFYVHGDH